MSKDLNAPTLCRGCKFTHRNLLFLQPDRVDQLGLCLQADGIFSKYVTHKTTCERYSPPTRFERILRGIDGLL